MTSTRNVSYPSAPTPGWPGGWAVVQPDGSTLTPHKTREDAVYYSRGRPVRWVPTASSPKGGDVPLDIDYYDHSRWHFRARALVDPMTGEGSIIVNEVDNLGEPFGDAVERIPLRVMGEYLSTSLRARGWFVVGDWHAVAGQGGWFVAGESAARGAVATVCRGNAYSLGPELEEQAIAIAKVLVEQRPRKSGPGPGGPATEPHHPPVPVVRNNGSPATKASGANGLSGS
jgi:hypothetical protein